MIGFTWAISILGALYAAVVVWLAWGLKGLRPGRNKKRYSVGVIIAARNEESHIGRTLECALNQTYPNYCIYVVDDRSTDRTSQIIQKFQLRSDRIRLIRIDETPPGFSPKKFAIDVAIRQCDQEIIATTDADCRMPPDWLERMVAHFEEGVGMTLGLIHYKPQDRGFLQIWQSFDFFTLMCAAAATARRGLPFAGAGPSLAYCKELYHQVGGFGEMANRLSGDDVLLIQLIAGRTSAKIRFSADPEAAVWTDTETAWTGFYRQRKRWASNSGIQWRLNKRFFGFLIFIFLVNLSVVLGGALGFWQPYLWIPWLLFLLMKGVAEFLLLRASARLFHREELLSFFPIWFVTSPFYVLLMSVVGNFGRVRWK
ncbi:MAG: hypothetical protein B6244_02955 [Candidatus Cloacimonetes bacterium 4572_55]|nr:MAG: hypothetical protein B6244_02955 [Candidatus Cloacimonetes bacterium 4572_55]